MSEQVHYTTAVVTWLLAVLSITTGNSLGVGSSILPAGEHYLHALWVFTVAIQAVFLYEFFNSASTVVKQHFVLNNVILFAWYWLLHKGLVVLALIAAALLLTSAVLTYTRERTYTTTPVRSYLAIHLSVTSLPLLIGLFLTLTHLTTVADLPKKLLGLRLTNLALVAHFIIVGGLLLNFADWGTGLVGSYLALSIADHHTKHHVATFAGVTGGILLVGSIYAAYNGANGRSFGLRRDEAPLLG